MVFFPVASRELTGAEGGDWSSKAYRAFNWAVRVEIWGGARDESLRRLDPWNSESRKVTGRRSSHIHAFTHAHDSLAPYERMLSSGETQEDASFFREFLWLLTPRNVPLG